MKAKTFKISRKIDHTPLCSPCCPQKPKIIYHPRCTRVASLPFRLSPVIFLLSNHRKGRLAAQLRNRAGRWIHDRRQRGTPSHPGRHLRRIRCPLAESVAGIFSSPSLAWRLPLSLTVSPSLPALKSQPYVQHDSIFWARESVSPAPPFRLPFSLSVSPVLAASVAAWLTSSRVFT